MRKKKNLDKIVSSYECSLVLYKTQEQLKHTKPTI